MGTSTLKNFNPRTVYITLDGLEKLRAELQFLRDHKRIEIAQRLKDARELNSTEENSEYDAAIAEQDMVENRIAELERDLHFAKVIDHSALGNEIITLGSIVKVEMDKAINEFTLVGKTEANPLQKKISNESPVGEAILGAKLGETVSVETASKSFKVKILEIR